MRRKKQIALLLSFVMVIVAAMSGNLQVRAAITNVSFHMSISVANGTNAPDHYGVDYQVVDAEGENVAGEGYSGNINQSSSSPANISFSSIDESYMIKFTVQSAGLSIRLGGNDVTNEGWSNGKTVPVSEVNGKNYNFELYRSDNGGGGNPPSQGDTYEISFADGTVTGNTVSYTVGDSTVTLTSSVPIRENKVTVGENDAFAISDNFDHETMEVAVYTEDGFGTTLNVVDGSTSIANRTNDGGIPNRLTMIIREKGNHDPNPPQEPGNDFDGRAYFVWQGENDALCVHEITGLEESRSQGEIIAFDIIYIPVSEVKDDVTGEQFEIGNDSYYWMWSSAKPFIDENGSSYTAFTNALDALSEPEFRTIAIDPCGAEDGESTVCTNGDRVFRATIYDNATFEGIAFSQSEDDYTYFPNFWDNVFFTNTVDISNTTAENPAVYEAFLIEPTIHFGKADNSVNEITGIRPLDVPDGAVTITENPVAGYDIEFGSNFFDNVVFEIETGEESYYIEIVRTAMQVFDTNGPEEENPQVVAKIFYDENESYSDYEVYATIHYKNGDASVQKIAVSEITDDGFGNAPAPGTYEMEAGKGLKCAQYSVPLTEDIEGIDFNAVKNGALSGNSYGGSYFGSENGVYYDIETREVIY